MEADRDNDGRPDDQKETWPPDRTIAAMSRQVLVDHYVNRDIVAVMRRMAPDMTWIGPLACQRTCSAEDMRRMLEPETSRGACAICPARAWRSARTAREYREAPPRSSSFSRARRLCGP